MRGFCHYSGLVSRRIVKECKMSPGNPVEFNQSGEDYETVQFFVPYACSANGLWA